MERLTHHVISGRPFAVVHNIAPSASAVWYAEGCSLGTVHEATSASRVTVWSHCEFRACSLEPREWFDDSRLECGDHVLDARDHVSRERTNVDVKRHQ
jgi:hypothetical protein